MSELTNYTKIEKAYEKYFLGNLVGYKDSQIITKAIGDFGPSLVLSTMQELVKQGAQCDTFDYIYKAVQRKYDKQSMRQPKQRKGRQSSFVISHNEENEFSTHEDMLSRQEKRNLKRRAQQKTLFIKGYMMADFPRDLYKVWINNGKALAEDPMPDELKEIQENFLKGVRA